MSRRIWTKPFIKYNLSGDRDKAKSLERRARACVGYLFDQLMPNQKFRSQNWNLADGSKITAFVWRDVLGERARVEIFAPSSGEQPIILSLFSGLFYTSKPVTPVVDNEYSRIYPHNWKTGKYGPWQTSTQLATLFNYGTEESFYYKKAGMYSGRMREVVQLLIGVDANVEDGNAGYIPYEYRWDNCHGIFINKQSGKWWVLWIDSEEGVAAWPLAYERKFTAAEQAAWNITVPGIPLSVPIYPRGSNPGFREIMSAEDIADAYTNGSPYYPEHGWAFSYDGSEAQAITVTYENEWKVASRWKLSFSTDENGDPVSAILEKQEQKCLYGDEDSAPKYPQGSRLSLLSYDIHYPTESPQPFSNDAPLDVFYKRSGGPPVIVRYGMFGDTDYTEEDNVTWPPSAPSTLCGATKIPADITTGGSYVAEIGTLTKTSKVHFTIETIGSPITPEQNSIEQIPRSFDLTWEQDGNWNLVSISGGGAYVCSTHHKATLVRKYFDTESKFQYEAFFKPFYDREAICLYEKKQVVYATGPEDTTITGGSTGSVYDDIDNGSGLFNECAGVPFFDRPSPICSTNYPNTSLGNYVLTGAISAGVELDAPIIVPNIPKHVCEAGGDPILYQVWCKPASAVTYPGPGCSFSETSNGETVTVSASQVVWIYNPRSETWEKTWEASEYDSLDPYTTYIDNPTLGTQMFATYFDVFSGEGFSYARLNYGNTDDLYYRGTLASRYNLDFAAPGFGTGWFGIP